MFLSKVTLKHGPKLFRFLKHRNGSDGYIAHQLLWDLFPNDGIKKRDFLFHKENNSELPLFYVVSDEKPLSNDALFVQTKFFSPQLVEGQKLAFTLSANPVVTRKTEGRIHSVKHNIWVDTKKTKKRELENSTGVFERTSSNLQKVKQACELASKEWLMQHGKQRCGFHLTEDDILIREVLDHRFYKKSKEPIRFTSIHYEGVLTVTNPIAFTKMLNEGLGKSKAFGCGLMLIRRV